MSQRYEHQQTTPALTWVIEHRLYTRAPIIDAFIEINGKVQKVLPQAVRIVSDTVCELTWSVPRAGKAGVI